MKNLSILIVKLFLLTEILSVDTENISPVGKIFITKSSSPKLDSKFQLASNNLQVGSGGNGSSRLLKLCNTFRLQVQDDTEEVILPCISDDKEFYKLLSLYKIKEGNVVSYEHIAKTDIRIKSYEHGVGFKYNISTDKPSSRIYKCVSNFSDNDCAIIDLRPNSLEYLNLTSLESNCSHIHNKWNLTFFCKEKYTNGLVLQSNYGLSSGSTNYTYLVNSSGSDTKEFISVKENGTNTFSALNWIRLGIMFIVLSLLLATITNVSFKFSRKLYKNCRRRQKYWQLIKHGDSESLVQYENVPCLQPDLCNVIIENKTLIEMGKFGKIYSASMFDRNTNFSKWITVKSIKWPDTLADAEADGLFRDYIKEIKIMQFLGRHPNIVKYVGVLPPKKVMKFKVYLIMESFSHQLDKFLQNHDSQNENVFKNDIIDGTVILANGDDERYKTLNPNVLCTSHMVKWAEEIAFAMSHLASKGIVHRCLIAKNILLRSHDGSHNLNSYSAQLSNFAMARDFKEQWHGKTFMFQTEGSGNPQEFYLRRTTAPWYAIEVLENAGYTSAADVWSFGCLLWEMFTFARGVPYHEVNIKRCSSQRLYIYDLIRHLKQGQRLQRPKIVPLQVWQIMKKCWNHNSENRPDFPSVHQQLSCFNEKIGLRPFKHIKQNFQYQIDETVEKQNWESVRDPSKENLPIQYQFPDTFYIEPTITADGNEYHSLVVSNNFAPITTV